MCEREALGGGSRSTLTADIGREPSALCADPTSTATASADRLLAAIVVEAALGLAAEPAGLDVFHQQRAGAVLRVRQPLVQHLHHRQAGIEADEVGELERAHRVVRAELHRGVDRLDGADALVERVDRLVDHRQQDAVDDEGREILGDRDGLAELLDELRGRPRRSCRRSRCRGSARPAPSPAPDS